LIAFYSISNNSHSMVEICSTVICENTGGVELKDKPTSIDSNWYWLLSCSDLYPLCLCMGSRSPWRVHHWFWWIQMLFPLIRHYSLCSATAENAQQPPATRKTKRNQNVISWIMNVCKVLCLEWIM
jgi:hypothetical protein